MWTCEAQSKLRRGPHGVPRPGARPWPSLAPWFRLRVRPACIATQRRRNVEISPVARHRGRCAMTVKPTPPSPNREQVRATVPKLIDLTEKVLFGDVWERPGLSKRDRSLITCAALVALNRTEQLKGHLERALNNGVTPNEISELITHLAFYGGWPVAMSAAMVAKDVLAQRKA